MHPKAQLWQNRSLWDQEIPQMLKYNIFPFFSILKYLQFKRNTTHGFSTKYLYEQEKKK